MFVWHNSGDLNSLELTELGIFAYYAFFKVEAANWHSAQMAPGVIARNVAEYVHQPTKSYFIRFLMACNTLQQCL